MKASQIVILCYAAQENNTMGCIVLYPFGGNSLGCELKKKIYIYIYLFWAVLGLCCGLSPAVAGGTALRWGARASHCGSFSRFRAQAPGRGLQ